MAELTRRFPGLRFAAGDQEIRLHPNISFRGPQASVWSHAGRGEGPGGPQALAAGACAVGLVLPMSLSTVLAWLSTSRVNSSCA